MDLEVLIGELKRALEGAHGLPGRDVSSIDELIRAGEWEVALEALCTQISEHELHVSHEQQLRLRHLGQFLTVQVDDLL